MAKQFQAMGRSLENKMERSLSRDPRSDRIPAFTRSNHRRESRMLEICLSGPQGKTAQANAPSLPLSLWCSRE